MAEYDTTLRTRALARIVGPYLLVVGLALYLRRETLPQFLTAFMQDEGLVFVAGAFTLLAGLALLAAHHHWSSLSAGLISFLGVAATLKGAALMVAPALGLEMIEAVARSPSLLQTSIGFELMVGVWLSFIGYAREHVAFAFAMKP